MTYDWQLKLGPLIFIFLCFETQALKLQVKYTVYCIHNMAPVFVGGIVREKLRSQRTYKYKYTSDKERVVGVKIRNYKIMRRSIN